MGARFQFVHLPVSSPGSTHGCLPGTGCYLMHCSPSLSLCLLIVYVHVLLFTSRCFLLISVSFSPLPPWQTFKGFLKLENAIGASSQKDAYRILKVKCKNLCFPQLPLMFCSSTTLTQAHTLMF